MRRHHACFLIMAFVACTVAYGVPVRFENPADAQHFDWRNANLNITQPASAQPGEITDSTIFRRTHIEDFDEFTGITNVQSSITKAFTATYTAIDLDLGNIMTRPLGWLIGPGGEEPLGGGGVLFSERRKSDGVVQPLTQNLPLGRSYFGVSFLLSSATPDERHYGWIGVDFIEFPDGTHDIDLFAWGYETDPNTAIFAGGVAVPAPGPALMLVIAAFSVGFARQRPYTFAHR